MVDNQGGCDVAKETGISGTSGSPGQDGDKGMRSPGPGLASPVRVESPASSLFKTDKDSSARDFSPKEGVFSFLSSSNGANASTEDLTKESASKEEVLTMLIKRTDQVKKLESKVSDLAANIKDKMRQIEKLETTLEKQQDTASQKLQEMNEQYQSKRAKMSETYNKALELKEQEKADLEERLKQAEDYKNKLFKREEENDEIQGLATQELSKVKHLLLNTQQEMSRIKAEALDKENLWMESKKNVKDLENEIGSLMAQIAEITVKVENAEDQNKQHHLVVEAVTKHRDQLNTQVGQLKTQLSQKMGQMTKLEQAHTELQNELQILVRNRDLYRHKTTSQLEEKNSYISHLEDRVKILEQRLQDGTLSGDERVQALEAERKTLEEKLSESRQQLTEVKTIWSDKITHLEQQISNLNAKIAEDSEELEASNKHILELKEQFQKQIGEWKKKAEEGEQKILVNQALVEEKDKLLEKQREIRESELIKAQHEYTELETELTQKISRLEADLEAAQRSREADKSMAQQKLNDIENSQQEWLEKEIETEKQITKLEDDHQKIKVALNQKEKEYTRVNQQLQDKVLEAEVLTGRLTKMEEKVKAAEEMMQGVQKMLKNKHADFQECSKEKDQLLVRNAELSQHHESYRRAAEHDKNELQKTVKDRENAISGLEQSLEDQQAQLQALQQKIVELEEQQKTARSNIESEEIDRLQKEISNMEDQLGEKTKTIKMQQQRLTDLKKTLQRELKVQSLPNDQVESELSDAEAPPRKTQPTRGSELRTAPSGAAVTNPTKTNSNTVIHPVRTRTVTNNAGDHQDINFEYLKHVVLKFMLSRETEAIHLIKAVSVLLHFTQDEQRLIKDTLEYKMSWFGSKPRQGKGQTAKVIPPSY